MSDEKYYIITCPFIDRPAVHRLWLNHFEKLDLPKKQCIVLWYDISESPEVERQLTRWKTKHEKDFHAFKYVKETQPVVIGDYGGGLEKRYAVASTFKRLKELKDEYLKELKIENADRVIIEDDILFPPETFTKLKKLADMNEDIWMTTGVNYSKNTKSPGIIAWSEILDIDFRGDKHPQREKRRLMKSITYENEKAIGYRDLIATSTGFVYIKQEAEVGYTPNVLKAIRDPDGYTFVNGQDMNFGWWITQTNKKSIMMDWTLKFPHLTAGNPIQVFKSDMCDMPINMAEDQQIYNIVSAITANVNLPEMCYLYNLVSLAPNKTVIEMGTHSGKSACVMAQAIKDSYQSGIVLAIDRFGKSRGWANDKDKIYEEILDDAKANAKKLGLSNNIVFIKGEFKDILPKLHCKAGLIFIDGDHKMAGVKENFEFAINNVAKNGMIVFHDYGSPTWVDITTFVDTVERDYGLIRIGQAGAVIAFQTPKGEGITGEPRIDN